MIGLIQRVTSANVSVDSEVVGTIGQGIVVLVGFQKPDTPELIPKFIERVLSFRVFSDTHGKMNLSVVDKAAGVLWVPQFTLAADTKSGRRPSFSSALAPMKAKELFGELQEEAKKAHVHSDFGCFGAHMHVSLINNGPVTFWLEVD